MLSALRSDKHQGIMPKRTRVPEWLSVWNMIGRDIRRVASSRERAYVCSDILAEVDGMIVCAYSQHDVYSDRNTIGPNLMPNAVAEIRNENRP